MPENNFEKNVQQRMEELKLQPSGTVWGKVYDKIRKEKKRRRFIVWFLLFAFLLLGGGGWWLLRDNNNRFITNRDTGNNGDFNKAAEVKVQPDQSRVDLQHDEIPADKIGQAQELNSQEKKNKETRKKSNETKAGFTIPRISKKAINNTDSVTYKEEKSILVQDEDIYAVSPSLKVFSKQRITDSDSEVLPDGKTRIVMPGIQKASGLDVLTLSKDSLQQVFSLHPKDQESMKKSNWEWNIIAGMGISNITKGIFEFFNYNRSSLADYASPGTGPSTPQGQQSPSSPTNGFSWQLGVQAKRKLSKKIGFSIGLDFSSYSNLQKTGSFKDTTVIINNGVTSVSADGIYRNGGTESFTNHFYYMEVPFFLHWQLNRGYKIPITWQNGISFGYLISSEALFYNASSNIFYSDKDLMNKTQWIYQTGFSAGLLNKTNHPVTAGLLFNYHLRSLQKQKPGATNHLTSLGVRLGWRIKK